MPARDRLTVQGRTYLLKEHPETRRLLRQLQRLYATQPQEIEDMEALNRATARTVRELLVVSVTPPVREEDVNDVVGQLVRLEADTAER